MDTGRTNLARSGVHGFRTRALRPRSGM